MSISDRDVARFEALFSGYERAHGAFRVRGADTKGKVTGRAITVTGPATTELYRAHLEGREGLGVVMLKEDDTVSFGAIDFDDKSMNHALYEAKVKALGLPLVLCKSKSNGGHFYCFTTEPVPAADMMERLAEWAALLGMSAKTEIFPKQFTRSSDTDIGSWINIPYFGDTRCAVINGEDADRVTALDYMEARRVAPGEIRHSTADESVLFEDGPPCLQILEAQGGFVDGTKKDGMFNVAVFLKKKHPDDWERRIDGHNRVMANITSDEVMELVKSIKKKDYGYKCKLAPINSVCNRRKCRQATYGVGEGGGAHNLMTPLDGLIRYEPYHEGDEPLFSMNLNGRRMTVTTSQFYNKDEFNRAAMSQANAVPVHMPPSKWNALVHEMIQTAEIVPLPEDASSTGQLWAHVVTFLTQSVTATEKAKVVLGVPYREGDKVWFRSVDLFTFLNNRRVVYKSAQHLWILLSRKGGEKAFWNLPGNKGVNVWGLTMPKEDEQVDTSAPSTDGEEPF